MIYIRTAHLESMASVICRTVDSFKFLGAKFSRIMCFLLICRDVILWMRLFSILVRKLTFSNFVFTEDVNSWGKATLKYHGNWILMFPQYFLHCFLVNIYFTVLPTPCVCIALAIQDVHHTDENCQRFI